MLANPHKKPLNSSADYLNILEPMRQVYEKMKARVSGNDNEWEVRKERLHIELFTELKKFQPDDPASKAVFIIGKVHAIVRELEAPRLFVADFETKRKRYVELCAAEGQSAIQL